MAWWEIYPKTKRGIELVNKRLVLDPERTPEPTNFSGMKNVFVKEVVESRKPDLWQIYKVMMTEQDINQAIEAMVQQKTFTFAKIRGKDFPGVEFWK